VAISKYEQDGPRVLSTAGRGETFAEIMARRLSRRGVIQGGVAASAMVLAAPVLQSGAQGTPAAGAGTPAGGSGNLNFTAITPDLGGALVVAEGYTATPFLRWGDPLVSGLADFDPAALTAEDQAKRIGYNHDFVGFLPLPLGESNSDHGLLVINHEYTNPELMFPGYMVPNPAFATPVAEGEEEAEAFVPAPKAENVDVE
jgi:secreted PhoX family phosphatase